MDNDYKAIIQIRLTPEEKKQAQKDAHKLEVSLSEYMRRLLATGHELVERSKK